MKRRVFRITAMTDSSVRLPDLTGSDVLAVGRRQAWLFVAFGAPTTDRQERTLWIDNPWRIVSSRGADAEGTLADLEQLVTLYVENVEQGADELSIGFDNGSRLLVVNEPARRDSDGWWLSGGAE
jgi:hypothetical protein